MVMKRYPPEFNTEAVAMYQSRPQPTILCGLRYRVAQRVRHTNLRVAVDAAYVRHPFPPLTARHADNRTLPWMACACSATSAFPDNALRTWVVASAVAPLPSSPVSVTRPTL